MDEKLEIFKESLRQVVDIEVTNKLDEIINFIESLKPQNQKPKKKHTKAEINAAGIGRTPKLLIERATAIPPQERIPSKK
jgi:hypothetical protein